MNIRGERECTQCGTRWSYYDTGAVACPDCGSRRSVGVDDRSLHTASPVELDLASARDRIDEETITAVATDAAETCREFLGRYGFIDGGTLQPLADEYVAATELVYAARAVDRRLRPDEDERRYLFELVRGADEGKRPEETAVPDSMASVRGLAAAAAVDGYRSDVRRYLDEQPDQQARRTLGRLREWQNRVEALDGEVPPETADRLVAVAGSVGAYLRTADETHLVEARDRLDELGDAY